MGMSTLAIGLLLTLKDQVTAPLKNITTKLQGLDKVSRSLAGWGAASTAAGLAMSGTSVAAANKLGEIARVSAAFDDQLGLIRSMPGVSEDAVQRLANSSRAWSRVHADTTATYLDSSYQMLSAGLDYLAAEAATETAMRVSKATRADATATANLMAVSYNNMGDKTRNVRLEMTAMGDVLTKTQQLFQIADMGQLGEGLKYAMPGAIAARMEFTQLNAVVGALNSAGMQGSMAGTALSASMRQMQKASQDLGFSVAKNATGGLDYIKTLENIQRAVGDFTKLTPKAQLALQAAFGDEGQRAVILLGKDLANLNKAQLAVADSAGAAARAQGIIEATTGNQWKIVGNVLTDLKVQLGGPMLSILTAIKGPLIAGATALGNLVSKYPALAATVVGLLALAAVAAPLLMFAGTVMVSLSVLMRLRLALSAVGGGMAVLRTVVGFGGTALMWLGRIAMVVGRMFLLNPIGLVVTAIAVGAYLIYRNWGRITAFFKGIWSDIKVAAAGGVGGLTKLLVNWSPVGLFYKAFAGVLKMFGVELPAQFTDFGGMIIEGLINGISNKFTAAKAAVVGFGQNIKGWFANTLGIKSPSRVFVGFGDNIGAGAQIGILGTLGRVKAATAKLAGAAIAGAALTGMGLASAGPLGQGASTAGMQVAQGKGGGAGGMTIHYAPQITVQGTGGAATGGVEAQVQKALGVSQREFEAMLNRVLADRQRRNF